jgi:hypothetical protein
MRNLRSEVITDVLVVAAHYILSKGHGAKASCGVSEEAWSIELVLNLPLELLIAQRRGRLIEVMVEVAQ